ncbi:MAG: YchJ family metal-binding protein [Pseudomonadota bacterium]|nr:YchJ family metal-binding protein [Pseudomonadota bacterium]
MDENARVPTATPPTPFAPRACPCDPARAYARCCGPLHAGAAAGSAQALMRSRYSAFVVGDMDYLLRTWHTGTRPQALQPDPGLRWLGLQVRHETSTGRDSATVEFVARCRAGGGSAVRLHEISRFLREDGQWRYVDGSFPTGGSSRAP